MMDESIAEIQKEADKLIKEKRGVGPS